MPATISVNFATETEVELGTVTAKSIRPDYLRKYYIRQGGASGMGSNKIFIGWTGSNLALQVDSTPFPDWPISIGGNAATVTNGVYTTGNQSIGGTTTLNILRITQNDDVTLTSTTHGFQIGPSSNLNIRMDTQEIQALTNGAASTFSINDLGGDINFGRRFAFAGTSSGNRITISANSPAGARTYTLPDAGGPADFVMTDGDQTIEGNKRFAFTTLVSNTALSDSVIYRYGSGVTPDQNYKFCVASGGGSTNVDLSVLKYSVVQLGRPYGSYVKIGKALSDTIGQNSSTINNTLIGGIAMFGCDGTANRFVAGASVESVVVGTVTSNCVPMRLDFCTRNEGETSDMTRRMSINPDGTVRVLGNLDVDGTITSYSGDVMPVGTVLAFARNTNPPGNWLFCNGASLNTTAYATLFGVIGYSFGGSGSSFNLPDLRGIFIRGMNSQIIGVNTYSGTFANTQGDNFRRHSHTIATTNSPHTINDNSDPSRGRDGGSPNTRNTPSPLILNDGDDPRLGTIGYTGINNDRETRPANITLRYCIRY